MRNFLVAVLLTLSMAACTGCDSTPEWKPPVLPAIVVAPPEVRAAVLQQKRIAAGDEFQAMLDEKVALVNSIRKTFGGGEQVHFTVNVNDDTIYVWMNITSAKEAADLICADRFFDQHLFTQMKFMGDVGAFPIALPVQCEQVAQPVAQDDDCWMPACKTVLPKVGTHLRWDAENYDLLFKNWRVGCDVSPSGEGCVKPWIVECNGSNKAVGSYFIFEGHHSPSGAVDFPSLYVVGWKLADGVHTDAKTFQDYAEATRAMHARFIPACGLLNKGTK